MPRTTPRTTPRIQPLLIAALALLPAGSAWADDDDDDKPAAAAVSIERPELSPAQQEAVGISLLHPLPGSADQRIEGYGQVLDAASLVSDAGHAQSTRIAARAAATEAQRLSTLYSGGADASLRAVESAQASASEAQTQAQIATATFALQWGPLAQLSETQLRALIDQVAGGRTLLVRADLPGRLRLGSMPQSALLDVDGTPVPAHVLGALQRSASDSQSVGLLLEIEHVPSGLGAGARVLVSIQGAADKGVLVPDGALLYGEHGAYVYRRLDAPAKDGKLQYAPVPVKLLQQSGGTWLVQGIDSNDTIVANGAGVLWSLQGLGTFSAEEEDHD